MKNMVVIVRGLPGSGKSRLAKALVSKVGNGMNAVVCSADDYFNTPRGYEFNPAKLPEAHSACLTNFICALNRGVPVVILDNTNTHRWEYLNYEGIALLKGYDVKIVEFQAKTIHEVRLCIRRNSHGVPPAVIANMAVEFESDDRAIQYPIEGSVDFSGLLAP
jgi:tRNA uridine 5-carbamoylmethylation protein Kti12